MGAISTKLLWDQTGGVDPSIQKEVITAENLATEIRTEKRIDLVLNETHQSRLSRTSLPVVCSQDSDLFLGGLASNPALQGGLQQAFQRYCTVTGFVNAETRVEYEVNARSALGFVGFG